MKHRGRFMPFATTAVAISLTLGAAVAGASAGAASPATTSPSSARPTVAVSIPANRPLARSINENLDGFDQISSSTVTAMQALHPKWARMNGDLQDSYDCTTGAWSSSVLDPNVEAAEDAGAKPVVIIDASPTCLTTDVPAGDNPAFSPPDLGANLAKWQSLVEEMAEHEITAEDVTNFEVWNEPNGSTFWNGTAEQYYQLYGATAEALEDAATAVHRTIEVGGPALADFSQTPDVFWLRGFLSYVSANHLPLNFLSWHQYFNDPDYGDEPAWPDGLCVTGNQQADGQCDNPQLTPTLVASEVVTFRKLLKQYGLQSAQLWLDEWNVNTGFDPRMDDTYDAAFVAAVLNSAQSAGLNRSCFFDVADYGATDNFGVLTESGTIKPDYYTFEMWSELAGRQLPVTITPAAATSVHPYQPDIGAVSSRGAHGVIHVELYDFIPAGPDGRPDQVMPSSLARRISVVLKGLKGSSYQVTRTVTNTTHSGSVLAGSDRTVSGGRLRLTADLEAQSLELLTLTPQAPG